MSPEQLALCIPIAAMFIPIVAIWTSHQRKMAEIKAQQSQNLSPDLRRELNEMKQQITELRDTTTRFDMSFDAAITRLEQRVDSLETHPVVPTPPVAPRVTVSPTSENESVIMQGRGR